MKMHKLTLLGLPTLLLLAFEASRAMEPEDYAKSVNQTNWAHTFIMEGDVTISRNEKGILAAKKRKDGIGYNSESSDYTFAKGSNKLFLVAKEDGKFESHMSLDQFRTELRKFGAILSEAEGATDDAPLAGLNPLLKRVFLNYGQGGKK